MNTTTKQRPVAVVSREGCVACGCCVKACPRGAIQVKDGVAAVVLPERCVGCGLCAKACPASVIRMEARQ